MVTRHHGNGPSGPPIQAAGALGSVSHRYNLPAAWGAKTRPLEHGGATRPAAEADLAGDAVRHTPRARLEAALWVADKPLTDRQLAREAGLDSVAEVREHLGDLRRVYADRGSALEIASIGGGRRLLTRAPYDPWIAKAAPDGPEEAHRLSGAALETLAVVAYRQPALRAEIEAIRGVGCGELLRQLLDADLLRIVGRSNELGRPLLYGTTARFLELFGLGDLRDLPRLTASAEGARPTKQNASTEPTPAA